jgi:hypothetical protein
MAILGKFGGHVRRVTGIVNYFVGHYVFNVCVVCAAFYHMYVNFRRKFEISFFQDDELEMNFVMCRVLIASHNCHGSDGERGYFCSKAWENCKRQEVNGNAVYINGSLNCPMRECSWFDFYDPNACKPKLLDYNIERSTFAILYEATNYSMRWVYT